jgi:hypothetical protein
VLPSCLKDANNDTYLFKLVWHWCNLATYCTLCSHPSNQKTWPCSLFPHSPQDLKKGTKIISADGPLQWWPRWMDGRPIYCLSWRDLARLHSLQGGSCRAAMAPKIKRPCFGRSFTKDLF